MTPVHLIIFRVGGTQPLIYVTADVTGEGNFISFHGQQIHPYTSESMGHVLHLDNVTMVKL